MLRLSAVVLLAPLAGCGLIHYAPAPTQSARLTYAVEPFQGYRTLQTDKGRFLCDAQGEVLRLEDGRAIHIVAGVGIYVVGPRGRHVPAPAELITQAVIPVDADRIGPYAVVRTTDNAALLLDAQGRVLLTEEGMPIQVLENGATFVEQAGERYAYDVDSLEIRVDVNVQLSLRVENSRRVLEGRRVDRTTPLPISIDPEGHVQLGQDGRPPFANDHRYAWDGTWAARVDEEQLPWVQEPDGAELRADADVAADVAGTPQTNEGAAVELDAELHVAIEAGEAGSASVETHVGEGVRALDGGEASLSMLLGSGVSVDGAAFQLGELGPLAPLAPAPRAARLETRSSLHVHAQLEHEQLPAGGGETNLVVSLRGGQALARASVQLHLVIDRSSSMQSTWPEVLEAARTLVRELGPNDRVQVVAYGTDVQEVLPLQPAGDGQAALDALGRIDVGGGTNIEVGLRAAYDAAAALQGNERALVILLSDGVPNGGAYTAEELAPMARAAQARGACTTTVIGLGNQFDPVVLRAIADAGAGAYHVARGTDELSAMLQNELHAQQRIAARDVRTHLALAEGVTLADGSDTIALPQLRADEERTFQLRLHVSASAAQDTAIGQLHVRYEDGLGTGQAVKALRVRRGRQGAVAMDRAAYVHVDKDLGRSLDEVAQAVNNGQFARASAVLEAHAEACAHLGAAPIQHRAQAARRLARALSVLGPQASHRERRVVSLGLGEIASVLLR